MVLPVGFYRRKRAVLNKGVDWQRVKKIKGSALPQEKVFRRKVEIGTKTPTTPYAIKFCYLTLVL